MAQNFVSLVVRGVKVRTLAARLLLLRLDDDGVGVADDIGLAEGSDDDFVLSRNSVVGYVPPESAAGSSLEAHVVTGVAVVQARGGLGETVGGEARGAFLGRQLDLDVSLGGREPVDVDAVASVPDDLALVVVARGIVDVERLTPRVVVRRLSGDAECQRGNSGCQQRECAEKNHCDLVGRKRNVRVSRGGGENKQTSVNDGREGKDRSNERVEGRQ